MIKKDFDFILKIFFSWRFFLFLTLLAAIFFVPLQKNFLGGGMSNYLTHPNLFAWLNFDGEHYLAIAQQKYQPLTYFFFPFYPLLVRTFAEIFGGGLVAYAASGLATSHLSFLLALVGLYRLASLDYKEKVSRLVLILLLVFPTSFFFAAFYTESVFLALVVWFFWFARQKKWLLAGILAAAASATRIVGVALFVPLLIEVWQNITQKSFRGQHLKIMFSVLLAPAGLLAYMYFLKIKTGDPFEFFNTIGIFGEQRAQSLIFLPQVFYRYFFKILPNLNFGYFPVVFTTFLEISTATIFLVLLVLSFWKLRLSYVIYFLTAYLVPTLSGSFSSFPRYALALFPAFLLGAELLSRTRTWIKVLILAFLAILLVVACAMFTRGHWVS